MLRARHSAVPALLSSRLALASFASVSSWRRALGRLGEHDVAHPRRVLARLAPQVEPVLRLRPVAGHDAARLVPVGLAVFPDAVIVLAQLRVRHGQTELPDLRHVAVEELLTRFLVAL